jgi:hypothetical protein
MHASVDNSATAKGPARWILADAARHTTVPTQTAGVIFGHKVRPPEARTRAGLDLGGGGCHGVNGAFGRQARRVD